MKKIKILLILTFFCLAFISLFTCYDCVAKGVTSGLYLCVNVVIPALFPFLCLTSCFAFSGVINVFANRLERSSKKFFNASGYFIPVFLISLVSGYPVGASNAQTLYKCGRISIQERNNIALVSCSAGPGFVLIATGVAILGSYECGVVLLACHLLASITVAVVVSRFFKYTYFFKPTKNKIQIGDALVLGIASSTSSIISICAYTVVFSAVVNVLSGFLHNSVIFLPVVALLEVTNAVNALNHAGASLPLISATIGFGGFSVIFQISSVLKNDRPPIFNIILIRLFHAVLSALFCMLALEFFDITIPVYKGVLTAKNHFNDDFLFSFSLLGLLVVFLSFFNKLIKREKFYLKYK